MTANAADDNDDEMMLCGKLDLLMMWCNLKSNE